MTGPVLRWALSLRRQLTITRAANTTLRLAVARKEHTISVLSQQLEQTRRDVELLALMAPDRKAALAFVRDAHTIERLEQADGG